MILAVVLLSTLTAVVVYLFPSLVARLDGDTEGDSVPACAGQPVVLPSGGAPTALPVGDLPGWRQVFSDDFTTAVSAGEFPGSAYSDRWTVYPDGWQDTSRRGVYTPSQVLSVRDGKLIKHLQVTEDGPLVAAALPKLPQQTYGRYSVRFRADPVRGFKTAWLLWPDSEKWPDDGEIDFPEGSLDGTIDAYAHHANPRGGQDHFCTTARYDTWHVATTEWLPGKVSFLLDGHLVGTSTKQVPDLPMHYVLQTETALRGGQDPRGGYVEVDWVSIYAPA